MDWRIGLRTSFFRHLRPQGDVVDVLGQAERLEHVRRNCQRHLLNAGNGGHRRVSQCCQHVLCGNPRFLHLTQRPGRGRGHLGHETRFSHHGLFFSLLRRLDRFLGAFGFRAGSLALLAILVFS